ncbi:hypothetical protein P8X24_06275 [Pyrococcus kukulkanii]|uniref:hypothetical protein n=1 Tax=Pyrococcus kukulkanii TaxID=1609559 RepID=UPI003562B02D
MKRLKELDEILKNSELTDEDAIELGRLVKKKARGKRLVLTPVGSHFQVMLSGCLVSRH